jgi:hypothetical protein
MNLDPARRSKAWLADARHRAPRPGSVRTLRALCTLLGVPVVLVSGTLAAQTPPPAEPKKAVSVEIADPPPAPGRSPLPDSAPLTGIPRHEPVEPAPEPPPPPPVSPPTQPEETELKLSVGGGMILFYYQPLQDPPGTNAKNFFEVFEARIRVDAEFGRWGMHLMPVIRDTKERAFFPSSAWVQEAYGYGKFGPVTVKAGKVWAQFGRFWDNSFYGNAQEFDGFKLDPNHGISVEGDLSPKERMGMQFFAQYFIIDGTTNYSLPGRDTLSVGGRRRNYLVGRVEPFIKLGNITTLKLAASGAYFQADLPDIGKQDVARVAVDTTIMVQNFTAWAEYTHQFGNHLSASPYLGTDPLVPHDKADYAMVGAEYTYDRFTGRYNFNMGSYDPIEYKEIRHVPGIGVAVDRRMFVLLEYVMARRYNNGVNSLLDHCLALTIHGKV